MAVLQKIKNQIRCFNSTSDVQRYEELMLLNDYLDQRIRTQEYKTKVAAANGNVEELRAKYVKAKLDKFDDAEKCRAEQEKWRWSPFYRIFKEWPLSTVPKSPWAHTQAEWVEIENALLDNVSSEPLSLEIEYPHIVRALLVLFRSLQDHTRPPPHHDA